MVILYDGGLVVGSFKLLSNFGLKVFYYVIYSGGIRWKVGGVVVFYKKILV